MLLPADTKMTKDIFHSLLCDTVQPPFFSFSNGEKNVHGVMLFDVLLNFLLGGKQ